MKKIEVAVAIIKKKEKILSTQRGSGEFKGGWEFPGGKIGPGESPQRALRREIIDSLLYSLIPYSNDKSINSSSIFTLLLLK